MFCHLTHIKNATTQSDSSHHRDLEHQDYAMKLLLDKALLLFSSSNRKTNLEQFPDSAQFWTRTKNSWHVRIRSCVKIQCKLSHKNRQGNDKKLCWRCQARGHVWKPLNTLQKLIKTQIRGKSTKWSYDFMGFHHNWVLARICWCVCQSSEYLLIYSMFSFQMRRNIKSCV